MTSDAFAADVLDRLENAPATREAVGSILIRALELAKQEELPPLIVDDLERSVYRLAGLPDPASTPLVAMICRWESGKWNRVLSAAVASGWG
jgi:hypothetical protein